MNLDLTPKTKYNPIFTFMYLFAIIGGIVILPLRELIISYLIFVFLMTFGVGFGIHRLYIHRLAVVPEWIKRLVVYFGAICNTGSMMTWGMSHYLHHTKPDTPDDPHAPAHYGWPILFGYYAVDKVDVAGNKAFRAVKHIVKDKFASHVHRKYYLYVWSWPVLMFALFGLEGFLAYGIMPTGLVFLSLDVINFCGHSFGYRNFETKDTSKNVWWLWPFAFGENWHNNHHQKPSARSNKVKWWELDPIYFWFVVCDVENHKLLKTKISNLFTRDKA